MYLSFNMQIDLKVGTCIHKTFVNGFNLWVDNRSILRQKIVEHNVLSCEHTLKGVPYITGRLLFKISWTFCFIWFLYADFKHLRDQNHREKSCYVASEFIAESVGWNLLKFWYLVQWIYSNTLPKKIRILNEHIKFYLKCMLPP